MRLAPPDRAETLRSFHFFKIISQKEGLYYFVLKIVTPIVVAEHGRMIATGGLGRHQVTPEIS
jgi:hypothetical protein